MLAARSGSRVVRDEMLVAESEGRSRRWYAVCVDVAAMLAVRGCTGRIGALRLIASKSPALAQQARCSCAIRSARRLGVIGVDVAGTGTCNARRSQSVWKNSLASGCSWSAAWKVLWNRGLAACFAAHRHHRVVRQPPRLDTQRGLPPSCGLRPSAARARSRLTADHLLRGRRGVKRCWEEVLIVAAKLPVDPPEADRLVDRFRLRRRWPSGEPFLAIFSHTPADWA